MPQVDQPENATGGPLPAEGQSAREAKPRWPQFSLRGMFLAVTALSVAFAAMAAVGWRWSPVVAWFLLLVAVHTFANAWGSRSGRRRIDAAPDDERPVATADPAAACAPSTRLRERIAPGRTMRVATVAAGAAGAALGAFLLWGPQADWVATVGAAVGIASAGGVGAFLGFLASSFLDAAVRALREAERDAPKM